MRRLSALILGAALAGCFGTGLEDSTTNCTTLSPDGPGFALNVSDPGRLVGRCVAIASSEDFDAPDALSKLSVEGRAFLPVDGSGEYYITVSARDSDDRYCAEHVGEFENHPGEGTVEVNVERKRICA